MITKIMGIFMTRKILEIETLDLLITSRREVPKYHLDEDIIISSDGPASPSLNSPGEIPSKIILSESQTGRILNLIIINTKALFPN